MALEHYGINVNGYSVRSEMHQGRPHIVVPAVMLRQGVMAGSHGPLLHLTEDYGRFVGAWNGIPVTINHPQEDGMNISANSPEVIDSQVVGRVYNASLDGDKLKAEVWIDEGVLKQISPEALAMIRRAEPMDVSVGVFTDDESASGDWNGTEYQAIARNHRPDHLSLLPGGVGACSFSAGCGLRTNEKGGDDLKELEKTLKDLALAGFSVNQLSYGDISQMIQAKLDRMDDDTKVHYLEETYPGFFIYRVRPRGCDAPMNPDGEMLFKRNYTSQGDNSIEFTGEAQPVVKKVDYVTTNQEKEVIVMTETKCCPEKVKALIADPKTKWAEADEPMLLTMSAEQIEKLTPVAVEVKETPAAPLVMTEEQAVKVLSAHLGDPVKFMALLPPEHRESVSHGLKLLQARRAEMVAKITTASPDVYTADELNAMSMDALEKVAKVAKVQTDFTLLGGGNGNIGANEGGTLLPPGVA